MKISTRSLKWLSSIPLNIIFIRDASLLKLSVYVQSDLYVYN